MRTRTGIGYDIHRTVPTKKQSSIPIGGVDLPCYFRVEAHSDGDVLLHALVDGLLGANALGDIGDWFPDSDEKNRGRDSSEFVKAALKETQRLGWEVNQVDSIIHLEEPRIGDCKTKIRENLAKLLNVELESIGVKAKSGEGLGPIGERKAIAAQVIVTLREK